MHVFALKGWCPVGRIDFRHCSYAECDPLWRL